MVFVPVSSTRADHARLELYPLADGGRGLPVYVSSDALAAGPAPYQPCLELPPSAGARMCEDGHFDKLLPDLQLPEDIRRDGSES